MAKEKTKEESKEMTPSQYFDILKGAKQNITTAALKESYGTFISLGEKYVKLGQKESLKRLCFLADTLVKEEKIIEMGINTFIYKDTIEDYIEHVADKTVKIVELSRYMREIPDELVETVEKTRDIFDEFYVVFTDYTGKEERKVEKERRDKDPILFGVFKNSTNVADRFYFLGDWVDEYCDLTLDKMVEQYKAKKGFSPAIVSTVPNTSEDLLSTLKSFKIDEKKNSDYTLSVINASNSVDSDIVVPNFKRTNSEENSKTSKGFFEKVRSVFKK